MIWEIFTDGSSIIDNSFRASSGAYQIYLYNRLVTSGGRFLDGGTNNSGETYAVLEGLKALEKCLKKVKRGSLKPPYRVRIYMDSLITRDACKEYIYKWLKNEQDGVLYNSSGVPVGNQDKLREIHKRFLTNEMFDLEFIHLNSHCVEHLMYQKNMELVLEAIENPKEPQLVKRIPEELFTYSKFLKAKKTFLTKNKMKIDDIDLLRLLIHNMEVDRLASKILAEGLENQELVKAAR
jgi:ribonuclease HI